MPYNYENADVPLETLEIRELKRYTKLYHLHAILDLLINTKLTLRSNQGRILLLQNQTFESESSIFTKPLLLSKAKIVMAKNLATQFHFPKSRVSSVPLLLKHSEFLKDFHTMEHLCYNNCRAMRL